ncbi:MAG: PEPxxWA-CTERM sorting domain-containing protein [Phenylobacterium sp.]|nr:PEPxxWA-CTERM sorting domain-containing protein [Phenylobacterium sp.]
MGGSPRRPGSTNADLWNTADTAWPKHGHASVNSSYRDGLILRWGPDGYDVGLDNVRFDVRPASSAVPEPGTWAMMILGTGCVGAALRRRRALRPLTA